MSFDPGSFDVKSFDPGTFDLKSFDPLLVNLLQGGSAPPSKLPPPLQLRPWSVGSYYPINVNWCRTLHDPREGLCIIKTTKIMPPKKHYFRKYVLVLYEENMLTNRATIKS